MPDERPRQRLLPRLIWQGGVFLFVGLTVLVGAALLYVAWTGEMGDAFGDGDDILFSERPWRFLFQFAWGVGIWLSLFVYSRKAFRTWRYRNNLESVAYAKAVRNLESAGSPFGNLLAKILLVPFILLGVLILFAIVLKMLGQI